MTAVGQIITMANVSRSPGIRLFDIFSDTCFASSQNNLLNLIVGTFKFAGEWLKWKEETVSKIIVVLRNSKVVILSFLGTIRISPQQTLC